METITQAVQNAGNAIWNEVDALRGGQQQSQNQNQTEQRVPGQYGEEPVSGIQGKGTVNDPYDAGNRDEQPNAPSSKENTAVITEPLTSITTSNDTHTQNNKANLVTSSTGPTNPSIHHPTPVQRFDQSSTTGTSTGASNSGPATLSTLKDEPVGIHRSTLKDEPLTGSKPTATETPTPASAAKTATPTAGAGLTSEKNEAKTSNFPSTSQPSTTSAAAAGLAAEKSESKPQDKTPSLPSTSHTQSQSHTPSQAGAGIATQDKAPGSSLTKDTTNDKKDSEAEPTVPEFHERKGLPPSKEALRGPSVAEPRKSYEEQGKEAQRAMQKDEQGVGSDQPKTTKSESNDKSHEHKNKQDKSGKDEHHHKSMKERINKVLHHH
ncbi:hypothetical protein BJX70DRAFT_394117 [Aspergillus crustosus]